MDLKHVVVVDDDIDVFDPTDVEWAIATRVQGDRDVMIVGNARAKPLDPSLPQGCRRGADRRQGRHRRDHPAKASRASTTSASPMPMRTARRSTTTSTARRTRAGEAGDDAARSTALADKILQAIDKEPLYYTDVAERFATYDFQHRRARARPSACDREAVAGPARPHVRARLAVRRQAAGEATAFGRHCERSEAISAVGWAKSPAIPAACGKAHWRFARACMPRNAPLPTLRCPHRIVCGSHSAICGKIISKMVVITIDSIRTLVPL